MELITVKDLEGREQCDVTVELEDGLIILCQGRTIRGVKDCIAVSAINTEADSLIYAIAEQLGYQKPVLTKM